MSSEFFESFAYDTASLWGQRFVPTAPVEEFALAPSTQAAGPSIAFRPLVAEPLELPKVGEGHVRWLLGLREDLTAVALAWALRTDHDGKCLIADAAVQPEPALAESKRVGNSSVYRGRAPRLNARLRDWLLYLNHCRTSYNQSILAFGGEPSAMPEWLIKLTDGVTVLSRADHESVRHARKELSRLRRLGVGRCDCLWLDAA